MTRNELIESKEYWMAQIQLNLFEMIEDYRKKNNLTKTQLSAELGVTKSYVTQILNGDFDHKVSKLVELSLAFGKVPVLQFVDFDRYTENYKKMTTGRLEKKQRHHDSKKADSKLNGVKKTMRNRKLAPAEIA